MPTIADHVLALVLVILFPLRALSVVSGRLAHAGEGAIPAVRLSVYRSGMMVQWSLTAVAAVLWLALRRPWGELGLELVLGGGLVGVLFGLALVILIAFRRGALGEPDDETAAALRRRTARMARMLPRTPHELKWFSLLAITAGICEEVLYRGFLIDYFRRWGLDLLTAAGISSVLFGLGHLYQGLRGMMLTAVVGGFLAAVYLISGSLFAGMLIHALMDLHSGRLLRSAYARESAAAPVGAAPAPGETV